MTVEVSGTAKLRDMGPLTDGIRSVGITLPKVSVKFYNLRPGMYCKFTLSFPEKHDIIEADEMGVIIARQKERQKIDNLEEIRLRQWYNDLKQVYDRGKKDTKFKVPEYIRRLFEEPDELEKILTRMKG